MKAQLTGNAGLFYISWRLTRLGWTVLPTSRNARGADLYLVDPEDEARSVSVQSKALARRSAVPLGTSLDRLRSRWWIITVGATSDAPSCYVLSLEEVRGLASRDQGGTRAYWLEARIFMAPDFAEAWHRIVPD
ncbi:hypothetical protein [Roseivivax halodurans]|uniref:hypothetical protein n=1 Tax=Roseivivax halodurans TaxID=93683 RepID=UPI0004AFE2FA|nr:hypothetical protein [Roseivivax halodurans]